MNDWRPAHNHWAIAFTVTLATFMEVLDTSIANVSLPHIAGSLSVDPDASTWVLTSYLVSNAVVLPVSGWLSGRFGRKRFYMTCVALFTISSFFCGLAPRLNTLIVLRVLQGAGGGGLQPSEQAILADTFPPEKRGVAFATYGMAVVLAPAIGPTLGGYITDNFNWRWIFFINVPVGLISLFLTSRLVEDPPWVRQTGVKIDYIGLSLVVLGLGCLQVVLDKGQREDWFASGVILFFTIVAALALIVAVVWEWHEPHPIVDVRLLGSRSFAIAFLMMFMLGAALFATTVLLPQYLQSLMGYTAQLAGMALSPGGLVVLLLLPLVGQLVNRVSARYLVAFGFALVALALFYMTSIYPGISFSVAVRYRILQSIGLAFLFIPITTNAYEGVPPEKYNQVSGMTNLARNIGGSVGISLATTLIARRAQHHQAHLVSHLVPGDPQYRDTVTSLARYLAHSGASTADAARAATGRVFGTLLEQSVALAYIDTIRALAVASACMVPLAFLLRRNIPGPPRMH
jgi:DHA2 family multidrug resistance protein